MTASATAAATAAAPAAAASPSLAELYRERSKHSSYQRLHPLLEPLLGRGNEGLREALPEGKLEAARQHWFSATLPLAGARVLDIGANTGYFSFGAIAAGAREVIAVEGNPEHAEFIRSAAAQLGLADRLRVQSGYYGFGDDEAGERFDIVYCLNVLHHLGDDFGERGLGLAQAKARMRDCLGHLAGVTSLLVLQTGFNWKGDRERPLYRRGLKAELIEHVREATADDWTIEETVVADPKWRRYVPLDAHNVQRFDELGEFMNRPMFRLRSRRG